MRNSRIDPGSPKKKKREKKKKPLTVSLSIAEARNVKYSRLFGIIPLPSESHTSSSSFFSRIWSALKFPSATNIRLKTHLFVLFCLVARYDLLIICLPCRVLPPVVRNIYARLRTCRTEDCKLAGSHLLNLPRTSGIPCPF
jgi:hypothetical protein